MILRDKIFLKFLALIFGLAFLSLAAQLHHLFLSYGIKPIAESISAPISINNISLFYLIHDDVNIQLLVIIGITLAFSVLFSPLSMNQDSQSIGIKFLTLAIIYGSFMNLSGEVLNFTWDKLLVSMGILASIYSSFWKNNTIKQAINYCLIFLLVKFHYSLAHDLIQSQSPKHFQDFLYSQASPSPLSFYIYQLDTWTHALIYYSLIALSILIIVTLFFNSWKIYAAIASSIIQFYLICIGNFGILNLLILCLNLLLIQDSFFENLLPRAFVNNLIKEEALKPQNLLAQIIAKRLEFLNVINIKNSILLLIIYTVFLTTHINLDITPFHRDYPKLDIRYLQSTYQLPQQLAPHCPRLRMLNHNPASVKFNSLDGYFSTGQVWIIRPMGLSR